MKVVLLQDVKAQGKKGDVIDVSEGYARNFLLPKGLAKEATKGLLNDIKGKKESEAFRKEQEKSEAAKLAAQINELTVKIEAKAGENGKLFGSITSQNVADALKFTHHIAIDKKKFVLPDGIKQIGLSEVEVRVYPDIHAKLKVSVVAS